MNRSQDDSSVRVIEQLPGLGDATTVLIGPVCRLADLNWYFICAVRGHGFTRVQGSNKDVVELSRQRLSFDLISDGKAHIVHHFDSEDDMSRWWGVIEDTPEARDLARRVTATGSGTSTS